MAKRLALRSETHRISFGPSGRDHSVQPPDTAQALPRTGRFRAHDHEDEDEVVEADSLSESR